MLPSSRRGSILHISLVFKDLTAIIIGRFFRCQRNYYLCSRIGPASGPIPSLGGGMVDTRDLDKIECAFRKERCRMT